MLTENIGGGGSDVAAYLNRVNSGLSLTGIAVASRRRATPTKGQQHEKPEFGLEYHLNDLLEFERGRGAALLVGTESFDSLQAVFRCKVARGGGRVRQPEVAGDADDEGNETEEEVHDLVLFGGGKQGQLPPDQGVSARQRTVCNVSDLIRASP